MQRHLVRGRGDQLGQDPGLGRRDREVREEARVLPVREGGQDQVVEVAQHVRERLAPLGGRFGQRGGELAGRNLREHRQLADPVEVACDPVDRSVAVLAEAHGLFRSSFSTCFQVRVFRTSSFPSQPRRAWPIASST